MNPKALFHIALFSVMILVVATSVTADEGATNPLVSTGKYWEARLTFVQYGEINQREGDSAQITLKGTNVSSALVLGVECTAITDQAFSTNESWGVSRLPSAYLGYSSLEKCVVQVERPPKGGVSFKDMVVYVIFGQPTQVYLSGITAKKGQILTVLFAYDLSVDNRLTLAKSPVVTLCNIDKVQELKLPVPWPQKSPEKREK